MGKCRPLSTDEIELMKAHCSTPLERALLAFFERTGYRSSEAASLRIKDLWDGSQIRDRVQVQARHMKKHVGRRPIPIHSELRKALVIYFMQLQERGWLKPEVPLWLSRKCKSIVHGLKRESLWRIIKKIASAAGIKGHIGCHSFRKVLAVRTYELSGRNIMAVKAVLGHRQLSSTQAYLNGILSDDAIDALFLAS